jgi:hypothetical protein
MRTTERIHILRRDTQLRARHHIWTFRQVFFLFTLHGVFLYFWGDFAIPRHTAPSSPRYLFIVIVGMEHISERFIVILAGFEGEDVVDFISPSGTVFFISWSREGKGREERRRGKIP